jgi:hypothetical protein
VELLSVITNEQLIDVGSNLEQARVFIRNRIRLHQPISIFIRKSDGALGQIPSNSIRFLIRHILPSPNFYLDAAQALDGNFRGPSNADDSCYYELELNLAHY